MSAVMSLSKAVQPYFEEAVSWAHGHPGLAVAAAACLLGTLYWGKQRLTAPRLPPGPPALPVLGSLLSLSEKMHLDIMRFRQQYGDVFTLWIGTSPMVILASYDAIKEAFLTRGADFAGRPEQFAVINPEIFQDGLFLAQHSEKYSRDKKFALGCLRQLGGVKAGADGAIVDEFSVLLSKLEEEGGKPVDIKDLLLKTTTNIISGILFNERMDHNDPKLARFSGLIMDFYAIFNEFSMAEALLPAAFIKLISRGKTRRFKLALLRLEEYIAEQVEEHRKSFDASNPRDFVDMYLNKPDMEIGKGFYDTIIAFSADAVQTMLLFMQWIVLYLGHHPDVQKKIQEEIDEVVGHNQMVTIAEKPKLKYTEAVLLEIMRCSDCSIFSAPHTATLDGATFRGYDIPRESMIQGSFYCVHKDPELFPDPEKFDPNRFLDADGNIVNANHVIPFSIGRRMCLGESLAKLELLLFLANVLHRFHVRFPSGEPKPTLEPAGGFVQRAEQYKAVFVPRDF